MSKRREIFQGLSVELKYLRVYDKETTIAKICEGMWKRNQNQAVLGLSENEHSTQRGEALRRLAPRKKEGGGLNLYLG